MKKIAFATCIYDGLHGTKFGGRNNRFERYILSLISIANTGADIICFCAAADYDNISRRLTRHAITNVSVVVLELETMAFHQATMDIKSKGLDNLSSGDKFFWEQRCPNIMYGKFVFLEHVVDLGYDNVYWIDAGLASPDVLCEPDYTKKSNYDSLFNPTFVEWLTNRTETLLAFRHTQPNSTRIPLKYIATPCNDTACIIAGLFGGPTALVRLMISAFNTKLGECLNNGELYSEEGIMDAVFCDNREMFEALSFQSWYHRCDGERYNPELSSFSDLFAEFVTEPTGEKGTCN